MRNSPTTSAWCATRPARTARSGSRHAGDGIDHITGVASPLRLSTTPPVLRNAAPALGQHTDEVLAQLGIAASRIAELRSAQVV